MADPVLNFARSTVATAPSPASSGTSLVLAAGEGALFPDPGTDGAFNVVLWPAADSAPTATTAEVVRVTARSTDTLTITREQEGTTGKTVATSWNVALTFTKKGYDDIVSSSGTSSGSGILTGGGLSIGTGGAGVATTFTIAAGTGQIVDNTVNPFTVTPISWTAKTDVATTNILTQLVTFVAIDSGGNVVQSATDFTPTQQRENIVIGVVVHSNQTTVNAVNQTQVVAYAPGAQVNDLMYGLGLFNVSGNVFSANGANLKLNKSAGSLFRRGSNYTTLTDNPHVTTTGALTQAPLRMQNQTGAGSASGTDVDVANYDVAGATTAISPATRFSILRVFLFQSNLIAVQRGQATYLSLAEAKAAIQTETYVTNSILAANGLLRGFIVAQANATSLNDTGKVFFIEAGKFGGSSGVGGLSVSTLQNAYDNSSSPEILTDSTRLGVTVKRGSGADTDVIIEGQNGAGSTTFSVTGAGAATIASLLDAQGELRLSGDLTPAQITGDQNNYAPTGHGSASIFRLSTDVFRSITGLSGGADGRVVIIHNIGTKAFALVNESASSTAANRFSLGYDAVLVPNQQLILFYDSTDSRWHGTPPPIHWKAAYGVTQDNVSNDTIADFVNFSVPAGYFIAPGMTLQVIAWGDYFNNSGASRAITLTAEVGGSARYADATSVLAVSATLRRPWRVSYELKCQASNSQVGTMSWIVGNVATATTGIGDAATAATLAQNVGQSSGLTSVDFASAVTVALRTTHPTNSASLSWRTWGWSAVLY